MRTIAHLSDLHFGRADGQMVARLLELLRERRPHLVVVSGDLTQRAKPEEFQQARAFLDAIEAPQIVVPGNHDVPLYDLYGRFVQRLDRYRRYIAADVEPVYEDAGMTVVSVNTARSLTFKGGRINEEQVERVRARLMAAPQDALKVLVTHHPLDLPHTAESDLAGRAEMALRGLAGCGIDLILSGHLHVSHSAGISAERLRIGGHAALLLQAGTAVSTRLRGEVNSFLFIEAANSEILVEECQWSASDADFSDRKHGRFERGDKGWVGGELKA